MTAPCRPETPGRVFTASRGFVHSCVLGSGVVRSVWRRPKNVSLRPLRSCTHVRERREGGPWRSSLVERSMTQRVVFTVESSQLYSVNRQTRGRMPRRGCNTVPAEIMWSKGRPLASSCAHFFSRTGYSRTGENTQRSNGAAARGLGCATNSCGKSDGRCGAMTPILPR